MLVLSLAARRMPPFDLGLSLDVADADDGSGGTLDYSKMVSDSGGTFTQEDTFGNSFDHTDKGFQRGRCRTRDYGIN